MNILEQWKELDIESITFEYDAGGDSISSNSWQVLNSKGEPIEISEELESCIEEEAYSRCEIYGDSNGCYIGAYGTITVNYNKEADELEYSNDGSENYRDTELGEIRIELSDEAVQFIQDKIKHIHFPWEMSMAFEYIQDCYLTDKDLEIIKSIEEAVERDVYDYKVEGYNVTETQSADFSTNKEVLSQENSDETELMIIENKLYGFIKTEYEYSY
jgi:hypothetical protein